MSLQAKYDPKQDRMLLTLYPSGSAPRALWVTRRQWFGLLYAVGRLLNDADAPIKASPQTKKKQTAEADSILPVPLQGIRLQRMPKGAKIVFVISDEKVTISMEDQGLRQLMHLLRQQAERAAWDVDAAVARMNAENVAIDVDRKTRRNSRLH